MQMRLRELSQPIKLFGESKPGRRERLRTFLSSNGLTEGMPQNVDLSKAASSSAAQNAAKRTDQFFYPGAPELKESRKTLIGISLARAAKRLCDARDVSGSSAKISARNEREEKFESLCNTASEIGVRPFSCAEFGSNGDLAVTDWSGQVAVWRDGNILWQNPEAHSERAQHVAWGREDSILISGGADNLVRVWNSENGKCESILKGHQNRINRVVGFKSAELALSASFDGTWRMWDISQELNLATFEGHVGAIYALAKHVDYSLVATGGLDGLVRLWDLRSGKSISAFRGHVGMVLAADFSYNGFHLGKPFIDAFLGGIISLYFHLCSNI